MIKKLVILSVIFKAVFVICSEAPETNAMPQMAYEGGKDTSIKIRKEVVLRNAAGVTFIEMDHKAALGIIEDAEDWASLFNISGVLSAPLSKVFAPIIATSIL